MLYSLDMLRQGLTYQKNLLAHPLPFCIYVDYVQGSEDNFNKIHWPKWQFYLPRAVALWDMSSPVEAWKNY